MLKTRRGCACWSLQLVHMKERLASCQKESFLRWSGQLGNALISRNGGGKYVFVQRNGICRKARKGMAGLQVGTAQCSLGDGGGLAGQFGVARAGMVRMAAKRTRMGRVGGQMVVVKAVRNAKGQKIDPEDVQVQSSMGEGSFGQVFQVS